MAKEQAQEQAQEKAQEKGREGVLQREETRTNAWRVSVDGSTEGGGGVSARREARPGEVHVVVKDETDGEYQPGPHCLFIETEDARGAGLGFESWTDEKGLRHIVIPTDEDPRVARVRAVLAQADSCELGADGALGKIRELVG